MRVSVLAVSAGATLAAMAVGLSWHHERDQAVAIRDLTSEVSALRSQLANPAASASAAPTATCAGLRTADAETAGGAPDAGVSSIAARAPGLVVPRGEAPLPPVVIERRVGDGGRPMSAEQAASLARATDLVDAAIRRGTITPAEMASLRARIDAAGRSEESEALRAQIADAIDQGSVVAERPPAAWH
jgi:hypothetical protein